MRRFRRSLFFASLGLTLACHDTTAPPTVSFKSISIYPRPSALVLNGSVQLRVALYDKNQNPVNGVPINWLSSSPAVVTVSDSGVVRSVTPGTAIISASAEGLQDTLSIAVTSSFTQLSTAGIVTCGISTQGAAFCRGVDHYGQLGSLFPAPDSTSFVPVYTLETSTTSLPFRAVYPGGLETCALGADSSAWCWGDGSSGELGVGPLGTAFVPSSQFFTSPYSPALGGHKFAQLVVGGGYVCGLALPLDVYCWGANNVGQTGDQLNVTWEPALIAGLQFQSIAGGAGSTCGVTPAGAAYCWGANLTGQLGVRTDTIVSLPVPVLGGPYQSLSVRQTTCALDPDGTPYCWGASTPYPRPQPVAAGLSFTQVSSALTHGCGLSDGSAYCWNTYTLTPSLVPSPVRLSTVTAGDDWDCGVGTDSAAFCWPTDCPAALIPYCGQQQNVSQVPGTLKFKAVSGNPSFLVACGQTVTDTLYCWGMNPPYYSSAPPIYPPHVVPGSAGVQLMPLSTPLCGLAADSTATCWQIGYSPGSDSVAISAPQTIPGGLHYSSFDRYGPRWCGTVAGQVYCGDSTSTPVSVAGATGFESVGTDIVTTCGMKPGGVTYCWGSNTYGELGIGYAGGWAVHPLPVSGNHQFLSVVVSADHGCGVATDSTTWCWGGVDLQDSVRFPPRVVPGGLKLGRLAAGFDFTCGLTGSGATYCWGRGLGSPTPYQPTQRFQSISASNYYPYLGYVDVCGLTLAGDPLCWNLPSTVPAPPRIKSRLRTFSGTSFPNRP